MRTYLAAAFAVSALALAACDSGSSSDPPAPAAAVLLIRQDVEPPGANCAAGGVAIRAGLDADGDDVLDDSEVVRTSYACGATPVPVLTRTDAIPPGAICAEGGTAVLAGHDSSGDGTLQDAEVEQVAEVCATPAAPVLAIVVHEPAGVNCPMGGSAVRSGADLDGDGVLDPEEISTTRYVCEVAALWGFTVSSEEDATLLARASVVRGDVVVESPTLESVWIEPAKITGSIIVRNNPKLQYLWLEPYLLGIDVFVRGSLIITDNAALKAISSPKRVGGDLVVARNPKLVYTQSAFEDLAEVDGSVVFDGNTGMEQLNLYALERVGGDFRIIGNPTTFAGPSWIGRLVSIGGYLTIDRSRGLFEFWDLLTVGGIWAKHVDQGHLGLPALRVVLGSVWVEDCASLGIDAKRLLSIEGDLVYYGNPGLRWTGDLRQLEWVVGDVRISSNPLLSSIWLQSLRGARTLDIAYNDSLSDLQGWENSFVLLESLDHLGVVHDPALAHLRFPALRSLRSLTVVESPLVPTCEAHALVAQTSPSQTSISGTDDTATCP